MTKKAVIITSVVIVLIAGGLAVLALKPTAQPTATATPIPACRDFSQVNLTVGKQQLHVALADTPTARSAGLSNCQEIPANSGMLFVFPEKTLTAFWMKDMLVPLDIIWIADGKVVGIEANAPFPSPGVADDALPQYRSPQPVDAVLELPAGKAKEYGLTKGTVIDK